MIGQWENNFRNPKSETLEQISGTIGTNDIHDRNEAVKIGTLIKAAREAANLTQEQLGEMIGTTGVSIMRYEKGLRNPRLELLTAIADALSVDVTEWVKIAAGKSCKQIKNTCVASIVEEIEIKRTKSLESMILGECLQIATENGFTTKYTINEKFVLNALRRAADNRARWKGKRGDYTCSRCKAEAPNDGYYPAPYCYECGAEMDKITTGGLEE